MTQRPSFSSPEEQLFVVEKRFPDLEDDTIPAVLERFAGAGAFERQLARSTRPLSAASLIRTDAGPLFVKRHAEYVRTPAQLDKEHDFIRHLIASGFRTPRPLQTVDGGSALARGGWTYEVFEAAGGEDRYRGAHTWSPFHDAADAESAGATLARLHRAAEGYDAPLRSGQLVASSFTVFGAADLESSLADWLDSHPAVAEYARGRDLDADLRHHRRFADELGGLSEPALWTHNDLHASNLFWDEHGVTDTIDFGLANRTFALYDLAIAIERNALQWLDILSGDPAAVRFEQIDRLLAGYESVRPLSDEQRRILPRLLPLAQAEAGLAAIEYYRRIGDDGSADWSYDVLFGQHTAWFAEDHGQAVLRWLEQRLASGVAPEPPF